MGEQALVTLMKGMKAYHNISHIRYADIAKELFRQSLPTSIKKMTPVDKPVAQSSQTNAQGADMAAGKKSLLQSVGIRTDQPTTRPECASLPEGWKMALDPATSEFYYWRADDTDGTRTWERPPPLTLMVAGCSHAQVGEKLRGKVFPMWMEPWQMRL